MWRVIYFWRSQYVCMLFQRQVQGTFFGSCVFCAPLDISTDSRPMYRLAYRSSVGRYVSRHIGRYSADRSTEICRSTYWSTYIGRVMVDISTDYRQMSRSMYTDVTDVYKTVASTPKKDWNKNFFFWNIGQKTWNLLKLLCCPLLVWNFSQPIACLKLFCVKFEDVPIISHFKSMRSKQLNSSEMRFGTLNRVQN